MDCELLTAIKKSYDQTKSGPLSKRLLYILILLVGLHSVLLGVIIFFFTDSFYQLFFMKEVENLFFVRQAGLFLICIGIFYFLTITDLQHNRLFVGCITTTKILAVLFLVFNAHLTPKPTIIYLAAVGDSLMAMLLTALYYKSGLAVPDSPPK